MQIATRQQPVNSKLQIIVVLLWSAFFAGCYSEISYSNIYPTPIADSWDKIIEDNAAISHITDGNTSQSNVSVSLAVEGWLNSLYLSELLKDIPQVLSSNKQLNQHILQIASANLDSAITYGAALPNLTLTTSTRDTSTQYTESLQFGLSGVLFDWGLARAYQKYHNSTEVARLYNYFDAVNLVAANLAKTTIDWHLIELQTQLAELSVATVYDIFSLSENQYRLGLLDISQLNSFREAYHQATDNQARLNIQLRNLSTNLKKLIGIYQPLEFNTKYPLQALPLLFTDEIMQYSIAKLKWQWSVEDIVTLHPNIQKAAAAVDQSNHLASTTLKSLFPRLSFSATSTADGFSSTNFSQSVVLSAVTNLFSWGSKIKEFEKSKINVNIAIEQYAQTIVDVFSDIDKFTYLDEKFSRQFAIQKQQAATAKQNMVIAKQRYIAGIIDFISFKQAETKYYNNLQQLLTSLGAWQNNRIDLYSALGLQPFATSNEFRPKQD